jgi:pimeloyl-ACP methyl ester carboxylesterase
MKSQAQALQTFDGSGLCARVKCKALCLAGGEDVLTLPAEVAATAAKIPGAVHQCFPHAGHSLLLESAEAFDRVVAFLRES